MNFGRFFLYLIICILGQRVITYGVGYACLFLGISNPLIILIIVDVFIGFFFAFLYRTPEAKRGCLKDPNFYRDAGLYALIFIALDFII